MSEANNGHSAESALQEIGEQTTQAVGENRQDLYETLDRIRRVEDLSEQAKSRLAEEARRGASERHSAIVDAHEQATKEVLANNERRLFKLSFPESTSTPSELQRGGARRDAHPGAASDQHSRCLA